MGHGSCEVTSHETMMTNIQRNPTIPMTKRDSLLSNGTRVSLLSNGSISTTPKKFEEKDYVNTNPNMVAGKKRSPKLTKVKRTASYKIATNRQSADDLDGLATLETGTSSIGGTRGVRTEDRTKYNTLPRTETVIPQKKPESRRRKRESNEPRSEFERTASQKSGTYPSPDTDEDQRSIQPDRKKKSTFKRMKERLILTFKKDRDLQKDKKGVKKGKSQTSRVKPNHGITRAAFNTPSDDIELAEDNNNAHHTKKTGAIEGNRKSAVTNGGLSTKGDSASPQSNKGSGFFQSIRNSIRRKQAPEKYRKGRGSTDTSGQSHTGSSSQPHSGSSLERDGVSTNGSRGQSSQPIDIAQISTSVHVHEIEEHFIDADDSITEIFGSLIDPECRSPVPVTRKVQAGPRPDTSKFRLEGLKKFKPRGFERSSPRSGGQQTTNVFVSDLSPTVEIDGLDYADAPVREEFVEESDLEYADVSPHEQHRRVDDVARRLAAIGDSIASRIETESAGSSDEIEGFRVGSQNRRLSQLEQELLTDLRRFGDEIDGTLFTPGNRIRFSSTILPIICNIVRAQDYSTFKTVIQREISNTVGWEQVAWYTYIMKATMDIAGAGRTIGSIVKNNATRYFSSTIKPWIKRQPNGWESIQEETDTECEVD